MIDPAALIEEIDTLTKAGIPCRIAAGDQQPRSRDLSVPPPGRTNLGSRSDRVPIGTTSRGIGPCYEDKIGRRGIRIADLLDPAGFDGLYQEFAADKATIARSVSHREHCRLRRDPGAVQRLSRGGSLRWSVTPKIC